MYFRLTNAPEIFQPEMNRIFFDLIDKYEEIYLDDIIVFSPSIEQHLIDISKKIFFFFEILH